MLKCTISYLVIERSCMNWWILEVSFGINTVCITSDGYIKGGGFPFI